MKRYIQVFILTLATIFFTSCGSVAKVYNIEKNTVVVDSHYTLQEAIILTLESLKWSIEKRTDSTITATYRNKKYFSTIEITYSDNLYSINLLDAKNLDYDASKQTIKGGYNGWIQNIEYQINEYMKPLKMTGILINSEKNILEDRNLYKDKLEENPKDKYLKIYEIFNKNIMTNKNLNEIEQSIIKASHENGWITNKIEKNVLLAKKVLQRGKHTMHIKISYDNNQYSIIHIASHNLNYKEYKIHRNYNIWIRELEQSIDYQLKN